MNPEHEKEAVHVFSEDETAQNRDAGHLHFDMERLLEPISEDRPAGENLRYEGTYDRIREARRADDPNLPQGVWERELKKADWNKVREICIQALAIRTKDIQIAVWLAEALMQTKGFAGLRDGLKLLKELCERFWDTLYPEIDREDGPEARVSPFVWMNENLSISMKMVHITRPENSMEAVPHSFSDWEEAEELEKIEIRDKKQYEQEVAKGRITRSRFLASVMFSSKSFYEMQAACLNESLSLLEALTQFLDRQCGKLSPSLGKFRDVLIRIQGLTQNFFQEKQTADGEEDSRESEIRENGESGTAESRGPVLSVAIRSRSDAYRMLSAAADYLLIHEPHSPTPYLVKRAVSWGHMPLTELLQELIMDEHDLNQIFKLLGLKGQM